MLHLNTVESTTYRLLQTLMQVPELSAFALVGGTNLSLRFGHRISVDVDLFTNIPFYTDEIFSGIIATFPQAIKLDERKQTLWLSIDGVKVDLILHQYPYLQAIEQVDGIRFLSVADIIPMKLEAMATRGVKKDFWDIYELLNHYSFSQMLNFYQRKYPNSDVGHVILSMTYFIGS